MALLYCEWNGVCSSNRHSQTIRLHIYSLPPCERQPLTSLQSGEYPFDYTQSSSQEQAHNTMAPSPSSSEVQELGIFDGALYASLPLPESTPKITVNITPTAPYFPKLNTSTAPHVFKSTSQHSSPSTSGDSSPDSEGCSTTTTASGTSKTSSSTTVGTSDDAKSLATAHSPTEQSAPS